MSADEQPPPAAGPPGASSAQADVGESAYRLPGSSQPRQSLRLARIAVAVLAALLVIESGSRIVPAIRAALHDGTRGFWVVTGRKCVRKACIWVGKFVLPGGHVHVASAQYDGSVPASIHAGTRIPGLYTGGGLVFPTTGSDLWISLLITLIVGLLGLYWATHRWVVRYLRQHADRTRLPAPLP
jgi:hypothetical protein